MNFQEALKNLIINDRDYKDEETISEESIKRYFESHIGFENDKDNFIICTYLYSESGGRFYPVREVICYSGAPGTGKTSFINTLKEATGRKLEKISCAGLKEPKEYSILGDETKPSLVA
jgi:ATP-dependent Lon protease